MSTWSDQDLISLFENNTPLIDVRAPVEYLDGSIPNSINLPIMDDEERRLIGTCYKENGQVAAIELGHEIIKGEIKQQKIERWENFIKQHPECQVFCFRGGLRSQISCQWMTQRGYQKTPIPGGYKRLRQFFLSWLDEAPLGPMIRISGLTGSGKTRVLLKTRQYIDLEGLANHRGSAFGVRGSQPSQVTFENELAACLMKARGQRIILEDESATIGKVQLPKRFFTELRLSPMVQLQVDPQERLENIFSDYVKDSNLEFFLHNLGRIQKKLGGVIFKSLTEEMILAFNRPMEISNHEGWISILLKEYYDPLYQKDLSYNQEKIIFSGKEKDVLAFLAVI